MIKSTVEVVDKLVADSAIRYLLVDGKEESATYIDDRKYDLVYPYSICIANEMDKINCEKVLLLGGGGFSIPKYYISHHQTGKIEVVEKFEYIFDLAKNMFFLNDLMIDYNTEQNNRLSVYIMDAIDFLKETSKKYSMIINDAYNGGEMASELLTEEAVEMISHHLENDGVYVINFFTAMEGEKRRAWDTEEAILKQFFSKIEIRQVDKTLPKTHRQNCIIIAIK